jgi:hypothetical protein
LLLLAVAVGAACWTKGTALTLLPGVPVAIAIAYRRARAGTVRTWGPPALAAAAGVLGLAFVLGGWWWAVNMVRYGRLQPAAYLVPHGTWPRLDVGQFLGVAADRMRWSFFGDLGVLHAPSLNVLTATLTLLFAVFCALGLVARARIGDRLLIALGGCTITGILLTTAYRAHLESHSVQGLQGRYLFVLVVPIAACFAAGLARIAPVVRLADRWQPLAVLVAGATVTVLGLILGFRLYYAVHGESWAASFHRFLGWSAWPLPVVAGLATAFVAAVVLAAWVLVSDRGTGAAASGP